MKIRAKLWILLTNLYPQYLRTIFGMNIGKNCKISWTAKLDKSINPKGIHIGDNTWVLRESIILSHDYSKSCIADTYIGANCIIGIRAIIMPGVKIGDSVAIGAGSIVTKDIPSNSLAVGNPAKVIKENIIIENGKIIN